jgi:hypothetical protein
MKNMFDQDPKKGDDETKINEEMEEMPLPEGAEMPDPEEMLRQAEKMAERGSPTTPRPSQHGFSSEHQRHSSLEDIHDEDQDLGYPGETDGSDEREARLDPDVISVATDVNRHGRDIDDLRTQIRGLNRKIEVLPDFDMTTRKMENKISSIAERLSELSKAIGSLQMSMNLYQTKTSSAIADVERRAALNMLNKDAKPDEELVPPPDMISSEIIIDQSLRAGESSKQPQKQKKKISLSDW